jgi:hypothetical protein
MAHSDGTTESSRSAAVNPQLIQPTLQVDAGMSFANFKRRQCSRIAKRSDCFRLEAVSMASGKLLQFPMHNPDLFSREINYQVLSKSEFNQVLCAAIRALPHVKNSHCREELKRTLYELLLPEDGVA